MALAGLEGAAVAVPSPWSPDELIWRLGAPWRETGAARSEPAQKPGAAPPWLAERATPERAPPPLNPSRALASFAAPIDARRKSLLEAGRLSHALLQRLPEIAADRRREAARRFLAERAAAMPAEQQDAILQRVLTLIADPSLAALFGPGSRAEVAVAANLARPGLAPRPFVGRIDRMAVGEGGVLIADFKSGAPPGGRRRPIMSRSSRSIGRRWRRSIPDCRYAPSSSGSTGRTSSKSDRRRSTKRSPGSPRFRRSEACGAHPPRRPGATGANIPMIFGASPWSVAPSAGERLP